MRGNVVAKCHAGSNGGGIMVSASAITIESNTVVENQAGGGGGGMALAGSPLVVARNIIAFNAALAGPGGLSCEGGELVTCNDFWNNSEAPGDSTCALTEPNLNEDPQFCGLPLESYFLESSSPCAPPQAPAQCGLIGALPTDCIVVGTPLGAPARPFAVGVRPNPARRSAVLRVDLPAERPLTITIFDVVGRHVRTVFEGTLPAGSYAVAWDGRNETGAGSSPGIYFAHVQSGAEVRRQKVVFLP
jgi:hypothetical protein